MTAGISFCILRNSEMLWGRPNHLWRKGECRINAPASHSFLRFSFLFPILFFFHALEFIPPFFLDRESYSVSLKPLSEKDH